MGDMDPGEVQVGIAGSLTTSNPTLYLAIRL